MKIKLDKGAYEPKRSHPTDAGLDICSNMYGRVMPHTQYTFTTGVHIEMPPGCCGLILPRSGLAFKHSLVAITGVIDEGFVGEIQVCLKNDSFEDYLVSEGDRIAQLLIVPVRYEEVEIVDEIDIDTDRGDAGIGSTGR